LTRSPLEEAIALMRQAQRLVDTEHPVIAAHLETVIGLADDRRRALAEGRPSAG